jgi:hypothetical protein
MACKLANLGRRKWVGQKRYLVSALIIGGISLAGCSGAGSSPGSSPAQSSASIPGTISYAALGSDGYSHIYTNTNGVATQLTSGANTDLSPSWNSTGTTLAFVRNAEVWTVNSDGSSLREVTSGSYNLLPSWCGANLVFARNVGPVIAPYSFPQFNIMEISPSGTNLNTLVTGTNSSWFLMEPRCTSDGSTLYFMCGPWAATATPGVQGCFAPATGGAMTQLTFATSFNTVGDLQPSLSTNWVFFSAMDKSGNVNLWKMKPDGSSPTQLTFYTEPQEAGTGGDNHANTSVVYQYDVGGKSQSLPSCGSNNPPPCVTAYVGVMNADGSGNQITNIQATDTGAQPRFQP